MPRSSASCFISSILTGMPALRKFMAMPPPMVPAPMMATELMSRGVVSEGTSGNLGSGAFGQEQVAQAAAFGGHHQVDEDFALDGHAVVKLLLGGRFHGVTHLAGAGKFLLMPLTMLRANWK